MIFKAACQEIHILSNKVDILIQFLTTYLQDVREILIFATPINVIYLL